MWLTELKLKKATLNFGPWINQGLRQAQPCQSAQPCPQKWNLWTNGKEHPELVDRKDPVCGGWKLQVTKDNGEQIMHTGFSNGSQSLADVH